MSVPQVGASAPQSTQPTGSTQAAPKIPAGISAYAVKDGQTVSVLNEGKWEPVRPGALEGIQLSKLPEYVLGADNGWHYLPYDAKANEQAEFGARELAVDGKSVPFLNGHYLKVDGQPMFITAINDHKVVSLAEVQREIGSISAFSPGSKVKFTVELPGKDGKAGDGTTTVVVRTIGQPKGGCAPTNVSTHPSESEVNRLVPFIQHGDVSESYGAHVAKFVELFPASAESGIGSEEKAFSKRQGGHDAVATAGVEVLFGIVVNQDKSDQNRLISPMLEALGDHKKMEVPRELVDKIIAKLPDSVVNHYGEVKLRPAVAAFITGAMQKTFAEAKANMAHYAKLVHERTDIQLNE